MVSVRVLVLERSRAEWRAAAGLAFLPCAFVHAAKAGDAFFSATKARNASCSFSVTFLAKRWFRRNLGSTPSVDR